MDVNIERIVGNWRQGYSLDKHVLRSTPIGENQQGYMQFDTVRSAIGESLFRLKYRSDYAQVPIIAQQLTESFGRAFSKMNVVIPMPPSRVRSRQPVSEIASTFAHLNNLPFSNNLLVKSQATKPMKDLGSSAEKVAALVEAFTVNDVLDSRGNDVLIIDDLFDTGSSLEAATTVLKQYNKIRNVYVLAVTRRR